MLSLSHNGNPRQAPKLEEGYKGSLERLTDKAFHKIHCRKYWKNLAQRWLQWCKKEMEEGFAGFKRKSCERRS